MKLQVEGVTWSVEVQKILDTITFDVKPGEFVGLLGPNGSGKSSLLRAIYRVLKPDAGLIKLDGAEVWQLSARQAAQRMGVVMQERTGEFDFSVQEIVIMGRNPHKKMFDRDTNEDYQLVAQALERVGMSNFAERSFLTLSGGEKQRVLIARALAQQAKFLILDEPTTHLDIHYQLEILELVKNLGVSVIAALHELNLAALFCDRIYVLKMGRVITSGTPEEVLRPDVIRKVYGVWSEVQRHPLTGKLTITFLPERIGKQVQAAGGEHNV